jgi:hypothetical protein
MPHPGRSARLRSRRDPCRDRSGEPTRDTGWYDISRVVLPDGTGVHVGMPGQELLALYGTRLTLIANGELADSTTATSGVLSLSPGPAIIEQANVGFAFRDGAVSGIGGTLSFC